MEKNQEKFKHLVPSYEKVEFLRWISKNQEMVYREGKWLIAFLLVNPLLVEKFEFIINGDQYKMDKALILSAYRSDDKENLIELYDRGFLFYNEGKLITEIQGIIKHIEESKDPIYVEINYKNYKTCPNYINVLSKKEDSKSVAEIEELDSLLAHITEMTQMNQLLKQIDESLISGDKEMFYQLTKELKQKQK